MATRSGWLLAVAALLAGCGARTAPPPEPGTSQGTPPDLRGRRVMVLPVQQVLGLSGDPDAELAFGLDQRGRGVTWISASEVDEALARSPSIDARTRGLPVGQFLAAEVLRIGDPLFGQMLRMSTLVDADAVLLPVRAARIVEPGSTDAKVRFAVALIESRTGYVGWFAILEGDAYPPGDPRALASAAERVTRTLLWYMVEP